MVHSSYVFYFLFFIFYFFIKIKSILSFKEWNKKRKIIFYKDLIEISKEEDITNDINEEINRTIFLNLNKIKAEKNFRIHFFQLLKSGNFTKNELIRSRSFMRFEDTIKIKIGIPDKVFAIYNLIISIIFVLQAIYILSILNFRNFEYNKIYPYFFIAYIALSFFAAMFFLFEFNKYKEANQLKTKIENHYNSQASQAKNSTPLFSITARNKKTYHFQWAHAIAFLTFIACYIWISSYDENSEILNFTFIMIFAPFIFFQLILYISKKYSEKY